MKSEFEVAFSEIADQRSLPRELVLQALSQALISAYRKEAGIGNAQRVEASIDSVTGRVQIFAEKEVVEDVQDERSEVDLETARFYEPEAQYGDLVMVPLEGKTAKRFGRIAAQTAKQVILQKIREAERESLFEEFIEREGDVMTGTVQSVNSSMVTLGLGRAEAIMPRAQQIPGEKYKQHEKVRVYIMEVKRSNRGPQIIVSRSHRNMLRRLLEYEVPEIYNGQIEIKSIAREAGYRSKVAVAALQEGIDPVGACVGMKGMRIQAIVKELHDEKIDVIEWSPNQEIFISKALSPARVSGVYLEDDPDTGRTAIVIVQEDQLSLAIGREGQNARLAAKLTGWRIDIKSVPEAVQDALDRLNTPEMAEIRTKYGEMAAEAQRILEKRALGRAIMPEEYNLLGRFADLVQRRQMELREKQRQKRIAEINAVKATLPQRAFTMPVDSLDVSPEIIEALRDMTSVGEIMWRFLLDENRLRTLLADCGPNALAELQSALDRLVIPEDEPVIEAQAPAVEALAADAEVAADALAEPVSAEIAVPQAEDKPAQRGFRQPEIDIDEIDFEDEEELDEVIGGKGKGDKKKKKKGRQLIFDEKAGGMVMKKRRKGNRGRDAWSEWDEE